MDSSFLFSKLLNVESNFSFSSSNSFAVSLKNRTRASTSSRTRIRDSLKLLLLDCVSVEQVVDGTGLLMGVDDSLGNS